MSAAAPGSPLRIGVAGCTGAVGIEIVNVLKDRGFPVSEVVLFASARSAGKTLETKFGPLVVQEFGVEAARACDVVFFAVSGSFATEHAAAVCAAPGGALVIDNSSAFRYDDAVPLVIPEINAGAIGDARLVANPNCTTAIAAMALWPLHRLFGLKKAIVSTYQAASGAGAAGMEELKAGARSSLDGAAPADIAHEAFVHPLPFNVIPHIDVFGENGYTKEEMKVVWETRCVRSSTRDFLVMSRSSTSSLTHSLTHSSSTCCKYSKIFGLPDLAVSCTAVRIPTFRAHAEAITLETERPVDLAAARAAIEAAPGVELVDEPGEKRYPMPMNATEKYDVECGRMRKSLVFGDCGLDLFVCGDQILRGAALNAVLIAEAAREAGKI